MFLCFWVYKITAQRRLAGSCLFAKILLPNPLIPVQGETNVPKQGILEGNTARDVAKEDKPSKGSAPKKFKFAKV